MYYMTYDICIYIVLFCSYMYLYYIHVYIYIHMFDIWFLDIIPTPFILVIKSPVSASPVSPVDFTPKVPPTEALQGWWPPTWFPDPETLVKLREISTANFCLVGDFIWIRSNGKKTTSWFGEYMFVIFFQPPEASQRKGHVYFHCIQNSRPYGDDPFSGTIEVPGHAWTLPCFWGERR